MNDITVQNAQRLFMTSVSLITSYGKSGPNVMAAEWTMQISYKPLLLAVFIHEGSSTLANIKKTRRFGVNVASEEQATLISVAGGFSRKELDKLEIKGMFPTIKSNTDRRLPMIAKCLINAECKVFTTKKIGDHTMIVGKVQSMAFDDTKRPIAYHRNKYFRLGKPMVPSRDSVLVGSPVYREFTNQHKNKFILKFAGAIIRSGNRLLVLRSNARGSVETIPYITPEKHSDYRKELQKYLERRGLDIALEKGPAIRRLVLKNKGHSQRVNFVLFQGTMAGGSGTYHWKTKTSDPFLRYLVR